MTTRSSSRSRSWSVSTARSRSASRTWSWSTSTVGSWSRSRSASTAWGWSRSVGSTTTGSRGIAIHRSSRGTASWKWFPSARTWAGDMATSTCSAITTALAAANTMKRKKTLFIQQFSIPAVDTVGKTEGKENYNKKRECHWRHAPWEDVSRYWILQRKHRSKVLDAPEETQKQLKQCALL